MRRIAGGVRFHGSRHPTSNWNSNTDEIRRGLPLRRIAMRLRDRRAMLAILLLP
jgi:hypothetical protein